MSLILAAIVAGGGALAATIASRFARRRRRKASKPVIEKSATEPNPAEPAPALSRAGFTVELGDVVEVLGRELWLEQGWLLTEGGDPVAALFQSSESVLFALPQPACTLYLVNELELPMPDDPPATIESGGVRFERVRRIPVSIASLGKSPPLPWNEAVLGEYRGLAGDALWVLGRAGKTKAWQGRVAREGDVERWGGGADTL